MMGVVAARCLLQMTAAVARVRAIAMAVQRGHANRAQPAPAGLVGAERRECKRIGAATVRISIFHAMRLCRLMRSEAQRGGLPCGPSTGCIAGPP